MHARRLRGCIRGTGVRWGRSDAGWSQVPGSEDISPNGIEISPDGEWYYVGGWGTEAFYRISRGAVVEYR